jgi:hypothetical protein
MTLEERQAKRFALLRALYERSEGSPSAALNKDEVFANLGWSRDEFEGAVEYLVNERLATHPYFGGVISITHAGVREVEQALQHPQAPTPHFPANINITTIHKMVNSQIQQGTSGSEQRLEIRGVDPSALQEFLREFRERQAELKLHAQTEAETRAELQTLEAQAASPKPKVAIVRESLASLRAILQRAAGVVAAHLLEKLAGL